MAEYRDPPSVGGESFTSDTTCNSVQPPYNDPQVIDEGSTSAVYGSTTSQKNDLDVTTNCKRRGIKRKNKMRTQPYRSDTPVSGQQTFFESESMCINFRFYSLFAHCIKFQMHRSILSLIQAISSNIMCKCKSCFFFVFLSILTT